MSLEPSGPLAIPDRRARRKAETRDRLLAAARKLFVELGYHATRPQDIARVADVAAGTFYTHFADKREAFSAFVAEAGSELLERVTAQPDPGNFKGRLAMSLHTLLNYNDENPGVLGVAFSDPAMIDGESTPVLGMREALAQSLAVGLELDIEAGQLRSDFDPGLIANAIVGLIHQALVYGGKHATNRDDLVEQVTRFCELALVARSDTATNLNAPHHREEPT